MTSLCDTCRAPGRCCRDFPLTTVFDDNQDLEEQWQLKKKNAKRHPDQQGDLPFIPHKRWLIRNKEDGSGTESVWRFNCSKLGSDGRCTIYATRPLTCRAYEPREDSLCAEFVGPPDVGWQLRQGDEWRLAMDHRDKLFHLFQAHVWLDYARAWDGKITPTGVGHDWVKNILRVSREECLRRAREFLMKLKEGR